MSRGTPIFLAILGLPTLALAAAPGTEAHGPNWGLLAVALLNVGILGVVLVRFARRPIHDFLVQRSRKVARAIEAAESRLSDAERDVTRWRERLSRVDSEIADILRAAGEAAEGERRRRIERATQTAERIRGEATALGAQEVVRARQELRAEVAQLSASIALSVVQDNLRAADHRRLVADYAERIGGAA